jgi:hypothetical protein
MTTKQQVTNNNNKKKIKTKTGEIKFAIYTGMRSLSFSLTLKIKLAHKQQYSVCWYL